jgi:hypothetical protein
MATIMASHIKANIRVAVAQPPIGIHAMDISQPPGIGMAPVMVLLK